MTTATPEQVTYHKKRIVRILDAAAIRHITTTGKARLASTLEVVYAMTDRELCELVRSAHVLAGQP